MKIQFSAFIKGLLGGYITHADNFYKALNNLTPVYLNDLVDSMPQNVGSLKEWTGPNLDLACKDADFNIMLSFASNFHYLNQFKGKKIGYTVSETTSLHSKWVNEIKKINQVWIPTNWGKQVLIANGVPESMIEIVPEGIDTNIFNPERTPQQAIAKLPGYKFLCVARWDDRKNYQGLLKAFDEEFDNDDNVKLIIACNGSVRIHIKNYQKVVFVNTINNSKAFARLYTSCDSFVLPTHGEGWGLPIMEAMACGLPTITTNWSGHTEFCNNDNCYLINNYKLVDAPKQTYEHLIGQWAEPDIEELKHLMRYVYENREAAKQKGLAASKDMRENWTWDKAAQKALSILSR